MIKIGIIGAGHLGKIHISLLKEIKEFDVIGFYDKNKEVSESVEKDFGIKSYPNAEELIKQCDAIDVVSPTPFHFDYAKLVIKAGKHVFIEKPVTSHPDEAKTLVRIAYEAGIVAQVGHVEQFNPAVLAAKPFITRPVYINAERLAVYNPRGTDVSVVLDLMIHDIDLVLSMVKSDIRKIQANGSPVICETDDIAHARIDFNNGAIANITVSRVALSNKRTLEVFQQENFLSIDLLNKTLTKVELKKTSPPTPLHKERGESGETLDVYESVIAVRDDKSLIKQPILVKPVNAIKYEFELFSESIMNNRKAVISLDDAYLTMKVIQQIMDGMNK
jgi:predicted dehydrogenase